jgi:transposase InsO family protein
LPSAIVAKGWSTPLDGVGWGTADNGLWESFFARLECEWLDWQRFRTHAEVRMEISIFIEGGYNPRRRHFGLDYSSPLEYKRRVNAGEFDSAC